MRIMFAVKLEMNDKENLDSFWKEYRMLRDGYRDCGQMNGSTWKTPSLALFRWFYGGSRTLSDT